MHTSISIAKRQSAGTVSRLLIVNLSLQPLTAIHIKATTAHTNNRNATAGIKEWIAIKSFPDIIYRRFKSHLPQPSLGTLVITIVIQTLMRTLRVRIILILIPILLIIQLLSLLLSMTLSLVGIPCIFSLGLG